MNHTNLWSRLESVLNGPSLRVVACSGGVDSLLLATVAHRLDAGRTQVAHAVGPAVPEAATRRVQRWAAQENWDLQLVNAGEFEDPQYLANPVNRCFYCKSHLYQSLGRIRDVLDPSGVLMSGTNTDDLQEFRPGLQAAELAQVRHPFVEAQFSKTQIRELAREMGLPFAELPASPCLASRLYTGTPVSAPVLEVIDWAESLIRERTGWNVVRCRVQQDVMRIEVEAPSAFVEFPELLEEVAARACRSPAIRHVEIDSEPYRSGRAFVPPNPLEAEASGHTRLSRAMRESADFKPA